MDRFADIKSTLLEYAHRDGEIHGVITVGSAARTKEPADEYSDLVIVTDTPEKWISGEYPARLGEICISFTEKTVIGSTERRVLYNGSRDVDFVALTPEMCLSALESGEAALLLGRGYTVLYDGCGLAEGLRPISMPVRPLPSCAELMNLTNDYFFHTVWTAKKILRGEYWTAILCLDAYLKVNLQEMLAFRAGLDGRDTWHGGRFLEKWADPEAVQTMKDCFARYGRADLVRALTASAELYARIAREAFERAGFSGYPEKAEKTALDYLKEKFGENRPRSGK